MKLARRIKLETLLGESNLPNELCYVVQCTVQSTRLWQREKADVAIELISHFQEGLELDKTPADLVKSFGDIKQAAQLIRRARKRLRPRSWRIARIGVQATGIFTCFYLLGIVYFIMGQPEPKVDYLALLNTKSVAAPKNERAWPIYKAALLELGEEFRYKDLRPGDDEWDDVREYLNKNVSALADVRLAAARPSLGYVIGVDSVKDKNAFGKSVTDLKLKEGPFENSLYTISLPHLGEMRKLARLLALDAHRAAAEGDVETVLVNIEAMLGIAAHTKEAPILIGDLVASSITALAYYATGELLATKPELFSDDQLRLIAHRLSATEDLLSIRFEGERYYWRDFVQRIYTDDGNGDGRLTALGLTALEYLAMPPNDQPTQKAGAAVIAGPLLLAAVMSRQEAVELHKQMLIQYEAAAETPMWKWGSGPGSEVDKQLIAWKSSTLDNVRYYPLVMLMPSLSHAAKTKQYCLANRDAVLVAIALELDRRSRGAWAAQLTDLVPDLLPEIPPDRFTGKPIRYAIVDGAPVIYSVGNDRDDDGGIRFTSGRHSRWNNPACRWTAKATAINSVDADWVLWPPKRDDE